MPRFNVFMAAGGVYASLAALWSLVTSNKPRGKTIGAQHNLDRANNVGQKTDSDNVKASDDASYYQLVTLNIGNSLSADLIPTSSFDYLCFETLSEVEQLANGEHLDNGPCSWKAETHHDTTGIVEGPVHDTVQYQLETFDFGSSLLDALIQIPAFAFLKDETLVNDEGGFSSPGQYEAGESSASSGNHQPKNPSRHLEITKPFTRRETIDKCVRYFAWGPQPSEEMLALRDHMPVNSSVDKLTSVEAAQNIMAVEAEHEHEQQNECAPNIAEVNTRLPESLLASKGRGGPRPCGIEAEATVRAWCRDAGKRSRFAHFFEKRTVDTAARISAYGQVIAMGRPEAARDDDKGRKGAATKAQSSGVYESSFVNSSAKGKWFLITDTHEYVVSQQAVVSPSLLQASLEYSQVQNSRTLAKDAAQLSVRFDQSCFKEQKSLTDGVEEILHGVDNGVDIGVQSDSTGEYRSFSLHADRNGLDAIDASPKARALVSNLFDDNDLDAPSPASRIELLQEALLGGARLKRISGSRDYILVQDQTDASTSEIIGYDDTLAMVERGALQARQIPRALEPGSCTPHLSGRQPIARRWSVSSGVPEELVQPTEEERLMRARFVCYDAPWNLGDRRNWTEISVVPFKLTSAEGRPATPTISEHGSDTSEGDLDESVRYSPTFVKYRRGPGHDENCKTTQSFNTFITSLSHGSSIQTFPLYTMKDRQSRHERHTKTQEHKQHTSIFDLAKTAQARVRGMEDPFVVSKKQRQYVEVSAIHTYEPSSPSASSMEGDGYLSDMSDELKEDRCSTRQRNRNAALAALEGRAQPVANPEPLMRTSRTEYADDVEAEHGQLHTFSPRPHRSATRVQREIQGWEQHLAVAHAEAAEEQLIGLGVTVPDSDRSSRNEALDWLNSDSPVDLRNGRPVFYYQPSPQADEFWAEMTFDQLNAQSGQ